MPKIKAEQILKAGEKVTAKKLNDEDVDRFVQKVRDQQDFILSLKEVSEENLKSVVQL